MMLVEFLVAFANQLVHTCRTAPAQLVDRLGPMVRPC
jgi:hypothetical protein